jgi:hypothetical protein
LTHRALRRPLAVSQLVIGLSTGALLFASHAQTALLFTSRAISMGSYAILYVYTPEVCYWASAPLYVYTPEVCCHA